MPPERKKPTRVWPVLRVYMAATLHYPWVLSLVILGTLGMQFVSVIIPLYLKRLIDLLSTGSPSDATMQALFGILVVYAALGAVNWVARRVQAYAISDIEVKVMADLTNQAFASLIGHSHDFFLSNFAGTLTRRVTRLMRAYEQVFDNVAQNFLPTIIFSIGSIVVLYTRNHWLGLAMLVWVLTFLAFQVLMAIRHHPLRVTSVAADSRVTGALSDVIGNHSAVSLFAASAYERSMFAEVVEAWRTSTHKLWRAGNFVQGIQQALAIIIEIGLLSMGVVLWKQGLVTVGDFILIQVYIIGLVDQVWNIGNNLRRLYDAFADASEMVDIMELPYAIQDALHARSLVTTEGAIFFDEVNFFFNEGRPILNDLTLEIKGGEKIALVGPSGAGKSTITKLLLRQYDVRSGSITIDGQDIREVTQESLHEAIAFVPQEPVLFHRTLRENILYGKRDATEEELIAAAKAAHCHEFISALPEGYNTYVGERGVKLSGGERQRIAIARAILKNAPILVLDEATSSLDSESEAFIQDALGKLMEGKTVIAIAHRLSTIMKMDRIIVMEHGVAVLSGTHNQLLAQESNLYKKLWEIQAGSFIADEA
jgi:ATP-binding cassette, subfamily B, bacterial